MNRAVRNIILFGGGGPGWEIAGLGRVTTLTGLAAMLTLFPASTVTQLGNYDARRDGTFANAAITATFTGVFDGGGYQISNLAILDASYTRGQNDGLFAQIGAAGIVKNLSVSGNVLQTKRWALTADGAGRFQLGCTTALLCGTNSGIVQNCRGSGTVTGNGNGGRFGGLIGFSGTVGQVIGCSSTIVVALTAVACQGYAGVLTGYNHGLIDTCTSGGSASMPGGASAYPTVAEQIGTFNASISGTTMTVNSTVIAGLAVGQTIFDGADLITYGTTVLADLGGGNWTVSVSQTVASVDMCSAIPPFATSGAWMGGVSGANGSTTEGNNCSFTASISGTTMTVTAVASSVSGVTGTIQVGWTVTDPDSRDVTKGTTVASLGTGAGGTGTYTLNNSMTVSSRTLISSDSDWATAIIRSSSSASTLSNSNNTNSANFTGNLSGYLGSGQIRSSSASGNSTGATNVGGLLGNAALIDGLVYRCYATGTATGTAGQVGGLAGNSYGTVDQCWASGAAVSTTGNVGGLAGTNRITTGIVRDSFAFGSATGGTGVGGLIGNQAGTMATSYSIGVPSGTSAIGGLIGSDSNDAGNSGNYWNTTTSGKTHGAGNNNTPTGITAQTTAQLLAGLPAGFGGNWTRDGAGIIAGGYPYLANVTAPAAPAAPATPITILLTGSGNWTVPADWNNSNNLIVCIGEGGNGGTATVSVPGRGGGAGARAKNTNQTLTPGAVIPYVCGAGSTSTKTTFNTTTMVADFGVAGTTAAVGTGGTTANSTGTSKFAGGAGASSTGNGPSGGGGGTAGDTGAGKNGGAGTGNSTNGGGGGGGASGGGAVGVAGTTSTGGNGGAALDGTAGGAGSNATGTPGGAGASGSGGGGGFASTLAASAGGAGGAGLEYDLGGYGGGGGGAGGLSATLATGAVGGAGGLYGAGGGGGGRGLVTPGAGGAGAAGAIIIRYTP